MISIRMGTEEAAPAHGKKNWTRSQRIRTLAEVAFQVDLVEAEAPPKYQQIAEKALQLNKLGLCNEAIARHLGVDGKTVAEALSWMPGRS